MPRIEILTIGDELIEGRLVDTNAGELSAKLADLGLRVTEHLTVGDDMDEMVDALRSTAARADAVLVSGGLGPTSDDLTAAAAAAAFGLEIERSREALAHTRRFFTERGSDMPPTNEKQADLPAGCTILPNPEGTAVGFSIDIGDCRLYFFPGVPRELRRMADESVLPDLVSRFEPSDPLIGTLKIFGKGESDVAHKLEGLEDRVPAGSRLTVQYRATFPEIHLRLVLEDIDVDSGSEILEGLMVEASSRLGRHVFAVGGAKLDTDFPAYVSSTLADAGLTLAAAEVASAGTVAQMLSASKNSRDTICGSFVALDPIGLKRQLDVEIDSTAEQVASAVRERLDASIGVVTFGSVDRVDGQRPGLLTVAAATSVGSTSRELYFPVDQDRFRRLAAYAALGLAVRMVEPSR
jgi:nicotinamide-nucleotide amidase